VKTIGSLRRLDRGRRDVPAEREQHLGPHVHEIDGQLGETLRPTLRISVFNGEVVALDVAEIAQGATGCFHLRVGQWRAEQQNAQTRDSGRLLRAASGHPATPLPINAMKSRRLMLSMGISSPPALSGCLW
jgi:hypothetical protein